MKITDTTANVYMTGTTLGGTATTGVGATAKNLLVAANLAPNSTRTFTVNYQLPETAKNGYQTLDSNIELTAHAVQFANNGPKATVEGCTIGRVCSHIAAWS